MTCHSYNTRSLQTKQTTASQQYIPGIEQALQERALKDIGRDTGQGIAHQVRGSKVSSNVRSGPKMGNHEGQIDPNTGQTQFRQGGPLRG